MGTYTTNYNLFMPTVGETGWGELVNNNFSIIDTTMKGFDDVLSKMTWDGNNVTFPGTVSATDGFDLGIMDEIATNVLKMPCTDNGYLIEIGTGNPTSSSSYVASSWSSTTGAISSVTANNLYTYKSNSFRAIGNPPIKLVVKYTRSYANATIAIKINGVQVDTISFNHNSSSVTSTYTYPTYLQPYDIIDISWSHTATNNGSTVKVEISSVPFGI